MPGQTEAFADEVRAARRNREMINELARWREEHGLSQAEVARRMHTSQPAVARLESHQHDAQLSTLARYITALGLAVAYSLSDRETGRETWRSGWEREEEIEADILPLPEIESVLRRINEIVETLGNSLDEASSDAVDNIIQSWVAAWIANIETGYAAHQSEINAKRGQALYGLAQASVKAQRELRELDRFRRELDRADRAPATSEFVQYRVRLEEEYRTQSDRVAAANAGIEGFQTAVRRYDSELDSENGRRVAAIAERHVVGIEAAAYARILMAKLLQDPGRQINVHEANTRRHSYPGSGRPGTGPAAIELPAQSTLTEELLSILQDPQIRRLAVDRAGDNSADDILQETFYQVARAQNPQRTNNLRAYFARILIANANRLNTLADSPRSDLMSLAERAQERGRLPSAEALQPADETALRHITIETWLIRLRNNREQLTAAVSARSPDRARYREVILAAAEALLESAAEQDISEADSNVALIRSYPEYFAEPGASSNNLDQRFTRARADVRELLRSVVVRDELL